VIPPTDTPGLLAELTETEWFDWGDLCAWVLGWGPWIVGDWMLQAPDDDAITAWIEAHPEVSHKAAAEALVLAETIRPDERRSDVGWAEHQPTRRLDEATRAEVLERAARQELPVRGVAALVRELTRKGNK